jgi:hypothetical protein
VVKSVSPQKRPKVEPVEIPNLALIADSKPEVKRSNKPK